MPRAHTEAERTRIRAALLTGGREIFGRVGLAKATIAELASAAGIGKGSFYGFFESKEALFMAVLDHEETAFKEALLADVQSRPTGREAVEALLLAAATRLEAHPFLRLLVEPATIQLLLLRLDPVVLQDNQARDQAFFEDLARDWKQRGWLHDAVEPRAVFDVVAAMFALSLQREVIGEDALRGAVREIAAAVAAKWTE
jgi:AcrR family transcriptional regulator